MRYRDLVQFDPLESVIQLREANQRPEAARRVKTYVVSDRMADQLINLVIPQLQIDRPLDNKGVLVVGNYGTGKSHLMSVLSVLAEYADLVDQLDHPGVKDAARAIAGRFKVVRTEIGGVRRSLRDILLEDLEKALAGWGIDFTFPPAETVNNNKDAIIAAVAEFQQRYPDQGLLLVVDELLDFLRTREERELILDLGFLREVGEVAALTPFRFLGGVQETLFENPRFSFVAEQLRRVRDRFEQVRISREDIAYVVSHRLLRKTDDQVAWITDHLRQFTPLYHRLAERLDEFARMFPIHPAYIETFERVYVAEKRHVLKTFSLAIRSLLDDEVPSDQPGLVSYDHYWPILRDDPAMRNLADVGLVIEKSNVLEGRVDHAYTRPHLLPIARRIIHALSVHRLTTNNIRTPLGATPEELRDDLCLYQQMPKPSADFLLNQVQVALNEIVRTVSGQFISCNDDNGQYYLDIDKIIDFDAKINERGNALGDDELNRYFFDALRQVLNLSDTTYVTNFRIWFWELPWLDRKVTRPGYLFFGAPDERSTAQPPRDFYVYILPPFNRRSWTDEQRTDEVIFELTGLDQTFKETIRLYAGARALATESAEYRQTYADKAEAQLRRLSQWLREHMAGQLQVTYEGKPQPVVAILPQTRSSASQNLEELVQLVSAHLLAPHFAEAYPDYPVFERLTQPVSERARATNAMEAVRYLAGRGRTNLAMATLAGLRLIDKEDTLRPHQSPYARHYLDLLQRKADENQVVNWGELVETVAGGLEPVKKDIAFKLEPEWVVVLLLALVYNGDIVLNVDGRETLDASSIERAATLNMAALADFRYYQRPRSLPLSIWVLIFEGLGLQAGLIRDENTREQAVRELHPKVNAELERVIQLEGRLRQGVRLWNAPLFTDSYTIEIEAGVVTGTDQPAVTLSSLDLLPDLRGYKQFLETLSRFNTLGKLRNLRLARSEVEEALASGQRVARSEGLLNLVNQLHPYTTYLAEAQANLPENHPWSQQAGAVRQALLDDLRRSGRGETARAGLAWLRELDSLKADYIAAYARLHRQMVLGPQGDERRRRLYDDPRLKALNTLTVLDLLNSAELAEWKTGISGLRASPDFHEGVIQDTPTHGGFRPVLVPADLQAEARLDYFDARLDDLLRRWRQALRSALTSETARHSLAAMTPLERQPIEAFLAQTETDPAIPTGFVEAAAEALRGIEALTLSVTELVEALKTGGLPCPVDELENRFKNYVRQAMRGHDARNTRLTLDQ